MTRGVAKPALSGALFATLILGGCVNPSQKISSELGRYGLDASQAECVGDTLEDNLSIGQLQQLGRAAKAYSRNDTSPGRLTVSDLVRVASQFDDARVPLEVGRAAARCGVIDAALPRL